MTETTGGTSLHLRMRYGYRHCSFSGQPNLSSGQSPVNAGESQQSTVVAAAARKVTLKSDDSLAAESIGSYSSQVGF